MQLFASVKKNHFSSFHNMFKHTMMFRDGTDLDDVQGNRGCADGVAIEVRLEDEQGGDDLFLVPCAQVGGRAWNDPGGRPLTNGCSGRP